MKLFISKPDLSSEKKLSNTTRCDTVCSFSLVLCILIKAKVTDVRISFMQVIIKSEKMFITLNEKVYMKNETTFQESFGITQLVSLHVSVVEEFVSQ